MNKNKWIIWVIVLIIIIIGGGWWYSDFQYKKGQVDAMADIDAQQEKLAKTAAEAATDAANPFQIENPLEGVGVNPFEDAKKALNPFAE